jgi:hypothetical protein
LVVGLALRFVVVVAVAVVAVVVVVVGRRRGPVRRAEGTAVLRSAHGCGGDGEGSEWLAVVSRVWRRFWRGERRHGETNGGLRVEGGRRAGSDRSATQSQGAAIIMEIILH